MNIKTAFKLISSAAVLITLYGCSNAPAKNEAEAYDWRTVPTATAPDKIIETFQYNMGQCMDPGSFRVICIPTGMAKEPTCDVVMTANGYSYGHARIVARDGSFSVGRHNMAGGMRSSKVHEEIKDSLVLAATTIMDCSRPEQELTDYTSFSH
jgi:hypothetical protein